MQDQMLTTFSDDGMKNIQNRIDNLRIDLGASGALLLNDSGQLLADSGQLRGFDLNAFLALIGNAMSASNAVVHLLRDDAAFDLHYHEGQTYEMYTTRLTDQIFLMLMLERGSGTTSRIGMAWLTLRRAVTDLRALIKQALLEASATPSNEIKSAVSKALDEALNLLDGDLLAPKSAKPAPLAEPPRPRKKLPGRDKPKPPPDEPPPAPPPPRDILNNPDHILTYEEARALGLINLDEPESNQ